MQIFSKQNLSTFIIGLCCGITAIMLYIVFSGQVPFIGAAGVGTGAADVNAKYLDGYGTAITTSASSTVLVTDTNGYLPDNSVDTGAILDGTIVNADINASAGIVHTKLSEGTGSGLDADKLDGYNSLSFLTPTCTCVNNTCPTYTCAVTTACPAGSYIRGASASKGTSNTCTTLASTGPMLGLFTHNEAGVTSDYCIVGSSMNPSCNGNTFATQWTMTSANASTSNGTGTSLSLICCSL